MLVSPCVVKSHGEDEGEEEEDTLDVHHEKSDQEGKRKEGLKGGRRWKGRGKTG